MKRILVTDGMDSSSVEQLKNEGFDVVEKFYEVEELKEAVKDFDAVVVRSATKIREPIIDSSVLSGKLKVIIRGGVGVDNIDVAYAESKGIAVRNTPNASSASVAEMAIGHMFSIARHIHIANHTMRLGEWNKKAYKGVELAGKTLGLIGFGRIARETGKRASALGMKVIYTNTSGAKSDTDFEYKTLDNILAMSDFISIHIPGSKDKKPVIGKEEFEKMKDGVYLVNTARGGVVCETELINALEIGKVSAAALDVFEEEPTKNETISKHPKISLTPHIGASTKEAQKRIGEEIVSIILEQLKN